MSSVFSHYAQKYCEKNLFVIPVRGKKPAIMGWQNYCKTKPTIDEIEAWVEKLPDCNLSVLCGASTGLCAVDIDTDDKEILDVIARILPRSPVAKRGRRGFTNFYRFDYSAFDLHPRDIKIKSKGLVAVEVLLAKHTVIPPSIHPDTNEPYEWMTDQNLLDVDISELPVITFQQVEKLNQALSHLKSDYDALIEPKKSGRNIYLGQMAGRLIADRTPIEDAIATLVREDANVFADQPLFSDKNEFRHPYPEFNALAFYFGHLRKAADNAIYEKREFEAPRQIVGDKPVPGSENLRFLHVGFHSISEKGHPVPEYNEFAEYMALKYNFTSNEMGDYIWRDKFYRPVFEKEFNSLCHKETKQKAKPNNFQNFYKNTRANNFTNAQLVAPHGYLNLANGVLDIQSKKLLPHSPKFYFTYILNHIYDESATCPRFDQFLNTVFLGQEDLIQCSWEIMGDVIIGGRPKFEKMFIFYGGGDNGKSTYLNVLRSLIGQVNVSSVSIDKLSQDFSNVQLVGKMANMTDEGPSSQLSSDVVKQIISGQPIQTRGLYQNSFSATFTARLLICMNQFPKFKDNSMGMLRRLLFMPFMWEVPEEVRDLDLDKKLNAELPGILNKVIEAGLALHKRGRFLEPKASQELKGEYREMSDSVYSFVTEHVIFYRKDEVPDYLTGYSPADWYHHYRMYCERSGLNAKGQRSFVRDVNTILSAKNTYKDHQHRPTLTRMDGKKTWRGISYNGNIYL